MIRTRRSVRQFQPRAVVESLLTDLVETARWAPSPHNSQPWRFIILTPNAKHRLACAMADRLRADLRQNGVANDEIEYLATRSISRIDSAPNALLCATVSEGLVLTGDPEADRLERQMAVQSVGAALQSLFLAAADHDLGTCWMAAPMYCPEVVRRLLNIPEEWQPQALVLIGYASEPGRIRPRLPLDRVLVIR